MRPFVWFLRVFVTAFGLTEPKPHQEKKAALFLLATLATLTLLIAGTVWLILNLASR